MTLFEISKLKNRRVKFKNTATINQFGDVWLKGHITAVMSHIVSIDGVPYSVDGMQVEELTE